jgi:hypothetical protein
MPMQRYDAIVIRAVHSGLLAAITSPQCSKVAALQRAEDWRSANNSGFIQSPHLERCYTLVSGQEAAREAPPERLPTAANLFASK